MLASVFVLALLPQQPAALAWDGGVKAMVLDGIEIKGAPELTIAEAYESASDSLRETVRGKFQRRAEAIVAENAPFWLPAFYTDRVVNRWLADLDFDRACQILDRSDRNRLYDWGESFQTTLVARENPKFLQRAKDRLKWRMEGAEERFLVTGGGTILFWGLLAVVLGWVDRLSRGYMTKRLVLVGLAMGTLGPAVAFLA